MTQLTVTPSTTPAKAGKAAARPYGRRWGDKGRDDPVAREVADRLHMSPSYVEHLLRAKSGINIKAAEIIKAFRALNDTVRLERFWAPLRAAYECRTAPDLTPEFVQWAQQADLDEDAAELRFWQTRSDKDLSLAIRAMDTAIVRQVAIRDALAAEEQRRMRGA